MGKTVRGVLLIGLAVAGLNGCDYWPPALQAQIEQLRAEAQTASAERAKLETQLMETAKMKDELQLRVEELTRLNRELAGRIANLEQNLAAEKTKASKPAAKASVKAAPAKNSGKAAVKPSGKAAAKKPAKAKR
ncbi:MAG: hypothetical protein FJ246_08710 [Nitrospira sp.]|nr:hypothetical protein [Nitrospira sp.]